MRLLALLSTVLVVLLTTTAADARTRSGADANGNKSRATTSRDCLTAETRMILERAEAQFGSRFKVVSTCRSGATIRGTHHPSQHRYGKAVDLEVPAAIKTAVVHWLYENAPGVTMTYRRSRHIHFDTGPYHALACGGCAAKKTRVAAH